jgi:hypothetical protein
MLLFPGPLAHFAVVEDQVVPWGRYQPTPFHYLHVLSGVVLKTNDSWSKIFFIKTLDLLDIGR